jgi:hypothetical protein
MVGKTSLRAEGGEISKALGASQQVVVAAHAQGTVRCVE